MATSGKTNDGFDGPKLGQVAVFAGLEPNTLARIAEELRVIRVRVGEELLSQGDTGNHMFVILEGAAEVLLANPGSADVRVGTIDAGETAGEMAILESQPRAATVRATTDCTLLRITSGDINRLLYRTDPRGHALFMMNLARGISRRLRTALPFLAQGRNV